MSTKYFFILCLIYSGTLHAQTTVYFIDKIKPDQLFADSKQYTPDMKFQSVGVEIYGYKNGAKEDSIFVAGESLRFWKDSIAFSVRISKEFLATTSSIKLRPIFYFKKTSTKGELSKSVLAKEQSVIQIQYKLKSSPSGANVYLIPRFYWERNPELSKRNSQALLPYLVTEGVTTVSTYLQEYVYIVLYQYKKRYSIIQISPNHLHPLDSAFSKLN